MLGWSCLRGPGIRADDWTLCIQHKSLQVPSGKVSADCCSQSLGAKQAYTWVPEPHCQWRITLPDSLPARNGIWENLVHQSTPEHAGQASHTNWREVGQGKHLFPCTQKTPTQKQESPLKFSFFFLS